MRFDSSAATGLICLICPNDAIVVDTTCAKTCAKTVGAGKRQVTEGVTKFPGRLSERQAVSATKGNPTERIRPRVTWLFSSPSSVTSGCQEVVIDGVRFWQRQGHRVKEVIESLATLHLDQRERKDSRVIFVNIGSGQFRDGGSEQPAQTEAAPVNSK